MLQPAPPIPWNDLRDIQWASCREVLQHLLTQPCVISGWAQDHDPLYDDCRGLLHDTSRAPFAALRIDDVVFIFVTDILRTTSSTCEQVLLVPHAPLKSSFPPLMVKGHLCPSSHWQVPQSLDRPDLIELRSMGDHVIAHVGTDRESVDYPLAQFHCDPEMLSVALSHHTHALLEDHLSVHGMERPLKKM